MLSGGGGDDGGLFEQFLAEVRRVLLLKPAQRWPISDGLSSSKLGLLGAHD